MAVDITTIPDDRLRRDLLDSKTDVITCEFALQQGITTYSGGSVMDRRDKNLGFVRVIEAELARRAQLAAVIGC